MKKNRAREEIYYAILKLCDDTPRVKTHLLYRTFTSSNELNRDIDDLIAMGLLSEVNSSREMYATTRHGAKYMEIVGKMLDMLGLPTDPDERLSKVFSPTLPLPDEQG